MSQTVGQKACAVAYEHWQQGIDDVQLALKSVRLWKKNRERFSVVYRIHLDSLNRFNRALKKLKELNARQSF